LQKERREQRREAEKREERGRERGNILLCPDITSDNGAEAV